MTFIKPMLASPMREEVDLSARWIAEEKYDGHRMCITIGKKGFTRAITRDQNDRSLPPHVVADLSRLPEGVYDGELISTAKTKAYGVTDLSQTNHLQIVIFDVMEMLGKDTKYLEYTSRRWLLAEIFESEGFMNGVRLSETFVIQSGWDVQELAKKVWARGGEGLILKKTSSLYTAGKRSKQWLKIKQSHTASLRVVGFMAGLLGPHAITVLEDTDGNQTTVKTLDTRERSRIAVNPSSFVGLKLRIEFQERTPDGGYRHPMWDRWESE